MGEDMGRLKASCVEEMVRELREVFLFDEKRFVNQLIVSRCDPRGRGGGSSHQKDEETGVCIRLCRNVRGQVARARARKRELQE